MLNRICVAATDSLPEGNFQLIFIIQDGWHVCVDQKDETGVKGSRCISYMQLKASKAQKDEFKWKQLLFLCPWSWLRDWECYAVEFQLNGILLWLAFHYVAMQPVTWPSTCNMTFNLWHDLHDLPFPIFWQQLRAMWFDQGVVLTYQQCIRTWWSYTRISIVSYSQN